MPTIQVAGRDVIVDEQDAHLLAEYDWSIRPSGSTEYVQKALFENGVYVGYRSLHRLITGCEGGRVVDHKNGNGLDNRRENLRVCTQAENLRNRKINVNNTSGFKGVSFDPGTRNSKPWRSRIVADGKRINLGRFSSPEEAHAAYCKASVERHGEFSRTA